MIFIIFTHREYYQANWAG